MARRPKADLTEKFEPRQDAAKRLHSVTLIVETLLTLKTKKGVLPHHLRRHLSNCLWQVTQASALKYGGRFWSVAAMENREEPIEHEHVYTRKRMVTELLKGERPVPEILSEAIGCVVTRDEHQRLGECDEDCDGWERYKQAGIKVFDRQTQKRVRF